MDESKGRRRLMIARISLVLFVVGVLAPLLTTLAILRSRKLIYINTVGVGNSAWPLQGLDAALVFAIESDSFANYWRCCSASLDGGMFQGKSG